MIQYQQLYYGVSLFIDLYDILVPGPWFEFRLRSSLRSSFSVSSSADVSSSRDANLPFPRLKSKCMDADEKLTFDNNFIMTSGIWTTVSTSKISMLSPNRRKTVLKQKEGVNGRITIKHIKIDQKLNIWKQSFMIFILKL